MPMYGGLIHVKRPPNHILDIQPPFFGKGFFHLSAHTPKEGAKRKEGENFWWVPVEPNATDTVAWMLPWTGELAPLLLSDTLKKAVELGIYFDNPPPYDAYQTLYSTPIDTVLRMMMHDSDNQLAEQLLLVAAGQRQGVLRQDSIIRWMLDSVLQNLPQRPRWVDGSGLSRYNLFSPNDLVQVLQQMWQEFPHERVLSIFPAGGRHGTVKDWYRGPKGQPYLFAKTGTMSGVHCLSGYLQTRSGRWLIFSFMHNNYVGGSRAYREEMERILEHIWAD
jgi:serine-type D-Ala-D-Ala carboxypeptidase/endopeptidase (penicillin-binding protein 4)